MPANLEQSSWEAPIAFPASDTFLDDGNRVKRQRSKCSKDDLLESLKADSYVFLTT